MNNREEYFKEYYKKNKTRIDLRNKNWGESNDRKDYHRNWKLKKRFNLTVDEYNVILNKQNNCCAICNKHESEIKTNLHVDHCHTTGKIRGLLCFGCNILLGKAKDNINTLNNAIDYLNNNNSKDN
tara:strand:+ start:411 stop:788 length:378 start_codon:yes stop_codon:yes gene_type:complete